jgi:hypothetical protein
MVRPNTGLSPRETQILGLVVQGQSNAQIQQALDMSWKTLSSYLGNIYDKATPDLPEGDPSETAGRRAQLVEWGRAYLDRTRG